MRLQVPSRATYAFVIPAFAGMTNRVYVWLLFALILLALPAFAQGGGPDLQRAHEALAEHQKETEAAQSALAQGLFNDADARTNAARAALQRAQAAFEAAGAPTNAPTDVLFEYADTTRRLGYHDLAGEAMETVVAREPENARAWGVLGASQIECGPKHEPRGLEALLKSLALDSASKDAVAARVALGKLYYAQGLYDFAREQLEQAVATDPAHPEAVIRLAALQARAGKIREANDAITALDKAAQPHDALARVLLRECLDTFERDGGTFEDNAANHVAFSKLLYRAARVPEALLAASRAVTLDPTDTATLNFAASMYTQLGNADNARQAYEKSLAVNPDQPLVQEALKHLPPPAAPPAIAAPVPVPVPAPAQ